MDLQLAGKTAVITGGTRGIGKAIARTLAEEGVDVAIVGRDKAALEATAKEIADATGRKIVPLIADTGNDASVRSMAEQAKSALGHVDILVNAAAQPGGQGAVPTLLTVTDEAVWEDLNVKVLGYIRVARALAPYMIEQKWGRIINISGLAARQAGTLVGGIRNVAVVAMSKNLSVELGKHGINVNTVHPATTRTEKTPGVLEARVKAQGITMEQAEQQFNSGNVLGRAMDAYDVANVVAFLASPKAVAVNGDVIVAGGGVGNAIYY